MVKFRVMREEDVIVFEARDTESGQNITLRLPLNEAKILAMLMSIAISENEEVQDDSPIALIANTEISS